jgi:hypothetical protein
VIGVALAIALMIYLLRCYVQNSFFASASNDVFTNPAAIS